MRNKMADLANHLFASVERLGDEGLSAEELEREIARGEAINRTAAQIVAVGALQVRAAQAAHGMGHDAGLPALLGIEGGEADGG